MIKAVSCRFHAFFGPFIMLTLKGSFETAFFRAWSNQVFQSLHFRNKLAMTIIVLSKYLKFNVVSRNWTKDFDNCIWSRSGYFSQFRTRYWPLAVNELGKTPKIYHINKGDIFQIRFSQSDEKYDERAPMQILQEIGTV